MGLWASTFPVIVGALLRSSSHVIAGPTNALSLLVGAGLGAVVADDPVTGAVTLALMVGIAQILAGVLRLGMVVDYVASPVVLGYITGAGGLIAIGQLYNLTGTAGPGGRFWVTVGGWVEHLDETNAVAVVVAGVTVAAILALRRLAPKVPAAIVAVAGAIVAEWALGLHDAGLRIVRDIAPIPAGLPPLTLPDLSLVSQLAPLAVACTVLSLMESNALARSIARSSEQRIDASVEFVGQGAANVAAAFCGGYPVSGSLSRSTLNYSAGGQTRMSGVFTGALMLGVLLVLGPVLDHTPVAALAGLLVVVALDLVDVARIGTVLGSGWDDRLAFAATLVGTWTLDLDDAIYLGVGVSVVLFLRKARLLTVREVVMGPRGELLEVAVRGRDEADDEPAHHWCPTVRILQVQGAMFFGAGLQLSRLLDELTRDERLGTLVLRLRRTTEMDVTVSSMLAAQAERMQAQGQRLIIVGVDDDQLAILDGTGASELIGPDNIYGVQSHWLSGLRNALEGAHADCGGEDGEPCPLHGWQPRPVRGSW